MSLKYPPIKSVVPQEVLLGCSRIFEQGITGRGHWKKDFDRDYITQSSFPTLLIFGQCGGQFLFLSFLPYLPAVPGSTLLRGLEAMCPPNLRLELLKHEPVYTFSS